jgi:hypothetical protein
VTHDGGEPVELFGLSFQIRRVRLCGRHVPEGDDGGGVADGRV